MSAQAKDDLKTRIAEELARPVFAAAARSAEAIRAQFGRSVAAVLFYGSSLRDGDDDGKILDFYVIVDRYRETYDASWKAFANTILPPNVFYAETIVDGRPVRAKVAVYSSRDFAKAASTRHFDSYVWARFAQPSALLYARDESVVRAVQDAIAQAIITVVEKTVPLLAGPFRSRELWGRAFTETYRAELRSEGPGKGPEIYAHNAARYDRLTEPALKLTKWTVTATGDGSYALPESRTRRVRAGIAWRARRIYCRALSVLRLIKAVFTFAGGIDYLAWKITRHSGVAIEISPWQRRHPLLAGVTLFWRLRRKGAFR